MCENIKSKVKQAILDATVDHYELLLECRQSNKCTNAVSHEAILKSNLLQESLNRLQFHSQKMPDIGASWREENEILTNAMTRYFQLLAVAQAPSLFRDCIHNGMYYQALLLFERVSEMDPPDRRPDNLFARTRLELWRTLEECFHEVILPRLSDSLTVDSAFKLIAFLKRLGMDKLCICDLFLERRTIYLDKLMREAELSAVPYSRAIRFIKIYSNEICETLTQCTAYFLSSEEEDPWNNVIQIWCYQQAERFITAFEHSVTQLTNSSELALVMEQWYNSLAMVPRVHMDLSIRINSLVLKRVKELFSAQIAYAIRAYTSCMRTFSWRKASDRMAGAATAETVPLGTRGDSSNSSFTDTPPAVLAQYLPLACALNGLLTAFNFSRRHVIPGIALYGADHIADLLERITSDLAHDASIVETLTSLEQDAYYDFVSIFVDIFYPYVLACTEKLFGAEAQQWVETRMHLEVKSLSKRLPG